jgi:Tfp pilus assembly protein PilF
MMTRIALALGCLITAGCGALATQRAGDLAFRAALEAQLHGDDARAEQGYRTILARGLDWSPVWNNLAAIAVQRRDWSGAQHMFAQAVAADSTDVVALTNYGVMSFHVRDFAEAERALDDARRLRHALVGRIPSLGRATWDADDFARATQPLEETAARYLERIRAATRARPSAVAELPPIRIELASSEYAYYF